MQEGNFQGGYVYGVFYYDGYTSNIQFLGLQLDHPARHRHRRPCCRGPQPGCWQSGGDQGDLIAGKPFPNCR